jgi:hypothetical protein
VNGCGFAGCGMHREAGSGFRGRRGEVGMKDLMVKVQLVGYSSDGVIRDRGRWDRQSDGR